MNSHPAFKSSHIDRAGVIRPDLIELAAYLCSAEYTAEARLTILDHAASGVPLADLTVPTADGALILDPGDLEPAEAALAQGRGFAQGAKGGMQ
jgi:hypothetical protein